MSSSCYPEPLLSIDHAIAHYRALGDNLADYLDHMLECIGLADAAAAREDWSAKAYLELCIGWNAKDIAVTHAWRQHIASRLPAGAL